MPTPEQYRRKLPHIQPKNAVLFITFRLKGTIPKEIMQELSDNLVTMKMTHSYDHRMRKTAEDGYYEAIEDVLDSAQHGSNWLKEKEISQIVKDSLHFLDGKEFKLICYCIMSNHVHFIAYNFKSPVYKIMNSLKSFTAKKINQQLNISGDFWQREYYDRMVRDRNDLSQKIEYILYNPVKIQLVCDWKNWEFSYCAPGYINM